VTHFLDANVFVYAALHTGAEGDAARAALAKVVEGSWMGVTSSLVVDQVVWTVWKSTTREGGLEAGERIYTIPHLAVVGVGGRVPQRALALMRTHPLKPRDAFHVATMQEEDLHTIVSADPDFDHVKEVRRIDFVAAAKRR
jgi:predicted nucleic acid-binding protein